MSKLFSSLADINFSKITSGIADSSSTTIKKVDLSSFTTTLKKTDLTSAGDVTSSVTKKVDIGDSLKKFETFPGAASNLSRVSSFVAKNPKLAAAGISGLAAAGYVAFLMADGATFEEATEKLKGLVGDGIEAAVDTTADVFGGIAGSAVDGALTGLLGENYMYYVYAIAVVMVMVMMLKLRKLLR